MQTGRLLLFPYLMPQAAHLTSDVHGRWSVWRMETAIFGPGSTTAGSNSDANICSFFTMTECIPGI